MAKNKAVVMPSILGFPPTTTPLPDKDVNHQPLGGPKVAINRLSESNLPKPDTIM